MAECWDTSQHDRSKPLVLGVLIVPAAVGMITSTYLTGLL